jgi:hypothetical protein
MDEHFLEATQESCHLNCSLLMGMSPPPYQWMVRLEQVHSRDWTWPQRKSTDVAVPLIKSQSELRRRSALGEIMIKQNATQKLFRQEILKGTYNRKRKQSMKILYHLFHIKVGLCKGVEKFF